MSGPLSDIADGLRTVTEVVAAHGLVRVVASGVILAVLTFGLARAMKRGTRLPDAPTGGRRTFRWALDVVLSVGALFSTADASKEALREAQAQLDDAAADGSRTSVELLAIALRHASGLARASVVRSTIEPPEPPAERPSTLPRASGGFTATAPQATTSIGMSVAVRWNVNRRVTVSLDESAPPDQQLRISPARSRPAHEKGPVHGPLHRRRCARCKTSAGIDLHCAQMKCPGPALDVEPGPLR